MPLEWKASRDQVHALQLPCERDLYWRHDFIPWKGPTFFELLDTWLDRPANLERALLAPPEEIVSVIVDDLFLNRLCCTMRNKSTVLMYHPLSTGVQSRWVTHVPLKDFAEDCVTTIVPRIVAACDAYEGPDVQLFHRARLFAEAKKQARAMRKAVETVMRAWADHRMHDYRRDTQMKSVPLRELDQPLHEIPAPPYQPRNTPFSHGAYRLFS